MVNLTANNLALPRDGGHVSGKRRAGLSAQLRQTRVKLMAASPRSQDGQDGQDGFAIELLRLYARARRSSAPAMGGLGMLAAAMASIWAPFFSVLLWLAFQSAVLLLACWFAGKLLVAASASPDVRPWRLTFIVAETVQGLSWAALIFLIGTPGDADARCFILVLLLLVAAMNTTISASIPAAVAGAMTPMTLATLACLGSSHVTSVTFALIALACGTQLYFMFLARQLNSVSLETLTFQAEKDELIAELEQAKVNSDLARRRAEAANAAKSRFLATMSHELRTPLNAILGFSEVLKGELFGSHAIASYKDYSSDIHASGQHLLTLINEILDLSRIEAGRFDLKDEAVALAQIVEESRRLLGLRAKKRHISIETAAERDLPKILADARAIRQVMLNLLSNAIKFTPEGGSIKIKIGWTSRGGQYVTVSDSGPGIPEEEIPVVMSSFGRGSLAQKNAEEGSGLGLPIVKGLIELHGGTFTLTSKLHEGTEVIVIFPPERVMEAAPALAEEPAGSRTARWLRRETSPAA